MDLIFGGGSTYYSHVDLNGLAVFNESISVQNISDIYAQGYTYNPYFITENFTITAIDNSTLFPILNFSANVSGVIYQSNNTGTISTQINDTQIVNITLSSPNYFNTTYVNYNTSDNLQGVLEPLDLVDFVLLSPNNTFTSNQSYRVNWTEAVSPTGKTVNYTINSYLPNGSFKETFWTTNLFYDLDISNYNNGNHLIEVNATEESTGDSFSHNGTLKINFSNYAYFQDEGLPLTNKSITVKYPSLNELSLTTDLDGKVNFSSYYNEIFESGIYNITFESVEGYVTPISFIENITYNQTPFNETYNVSQTNITINFYDRETGLFVTETVSFSIENLFGNTTNTGTYSFNGLTLTTGTQNIYASAPSYDISSTAFIYTGQDDVTINIYLVNSTSANIIRLITRVYDLGYNLLPNSDLRLQEYDGANDTFKEIDQCYSDSNGECVFQVEEGVKVYKVVAFAVIEGVTYSQQSSETGSPILLDQTIYELYLGAGNVYEVSDLYDLRAYLFNTELVDNISYAQGIFVDYAGISHEICLAYYYMDFFKKTLWTNSTICENSASGTLQVDGGKILNRSYTNIIDLYVNQSGNIIVYDTRTYPSAESSLEAQVGAFIKPLFIFMLSVIFALTWYFKRIGFYTMGVIVLLLFANAFSPSLIGGFTNSAGIVCSLWVLWLAKKESDNSHINYNTKVWVRSFRKRPNWGNKLKQQFYRLHN
jgi:hypothetical protein